MIPVTHPGVNVDLLHPVLKARLEALAADPRMEGRLAVVSGVRTKAEQIYLWNLFQAGQGNTAANPWATVPTTWYDIGANYGKRWGSWHMEQPTGFGYAVDLNYSSLPAHIQKILKSVAAEYKLVETVFSPQYEPWHYQMDPKDWTWVPVVTPPTPVKEWDEMATKKEVKDALREVLDEHNTQARVDYVFEELARNQHSSDFPAAKGPTLKAKMDFVEKEIRGKAARTANKLLEANNRWIRSVAVKVGASLDDVK